MATVAGAILGFRDRPGPGPSASACSDRNTASVVMAPYLVHGLDSFPGSWFWDGFAYMAAGESLCRFTVVDSSLGFELFYQFGHQFAQQRYISSSSLAMMKGIYPLGGDAQGCHGYFLFLCLFTFSASCYFLAEVTMPGSSTLANCLRCSDHVSGPILNLVWANNFDHLLAMSLAPVILGLASGCAGVRLAMLFCSAFLSPAEVSYLPGDGRAVCDAGGANSSAVSSCRERTARDRWPAPRCRRRSSFCLSLLAWPDLYTFLVNQVNAVAGAELRNSTARQRLLPNVLLWRLRPGGMVRYVSALCAVRGHFCSLRESSSSASAAGPLSPHRCFTWRRHIALVVARAAPRDGGSILPDHCRDAARRV